MKRHLIHCSIALGLLSAGTLAVASPNLYILVGGGGSYLFDAKLSQTIINRTDINAFVHNYSISYIPDNAFAYMGRAALGYYFYRDPSNSYAFGLETGYNYFAPLNATVKNTLNIPAVNINESVTTKSKTNAWSSDASIVYLQGLPNPHMSVLFKAGVAYESISTQYTNSVPALPGVLPATVNTTDSGIGGLVGAGIEYDFTKNVGLRLEMDGMKGKKNIGYAQGLMGLVVNF